MISEMSRMSKLSKSSKSSLTEPPAATEPADHSRAPSSRADRSGFTILEIMIATAILTLGLVSVLALFPAAIYTGRRVMENSTSVVIAESIAEAIREGVRNHLRTSTTSSGEEDRYFIFRHDGVMSPVPNGRSSETPRADYFILLPRFRDSARYSGQNEIERRENATLEGKIFVYPEVANDPNGGGNARLATDDGVSDSIDGFRYKTVGVVRKTYQLGQLMPGKEADPEAEDVLQDQQIETLKQYSYAFAIRNSMWDTNLSDDNSSYRPGNQLYHVKIMIFRAFVEPKDDKKHQDPVFELQFEVAI